MAPESTAIGRRCSPGWSRWWPPTCGRLFTGAEVVASYPFHVTRDSDIDLDEDDGDDDEVNLMTVMRESIAQRAFGPVVRLMIDRTMPDDVRDWLVEHLGATDDDLYVVDGPLATEDLWELVAIDRPDLKDASADAGAGSQAVRGPRAGSGGCLCLDPRAGHSDPPSLSVIRGGRRFPARGGHRSQRRGHQADAVPHRQGLAA